MDAAPAPARPLGALVGFAHALRAAGLPVTSERTGSFLDAAARLGAQHPAGVYWAGRATLCARPADLAVFDRTFQHWFGGDAATSPPAAARATQAVVQAGLEDSDGDEDGVYAFAAIASDEEVLGHRDIASLTADERRRLARLFDALPVRVPERRSARRRPAGHGEIDAARTIRDQLRHAGEPGPLRHRRRRRTPRRVVFLIDVSGSMAPYADSLLRLAHRVVAAAPRTTEVFTMGTALTRVTPALRAHNAERALRAAGESIADWSGGTRLGSGLAAFLDQWGQRGLARSAVVVIASDGWEVGDADLLRAQMQRLARLAHAVVWSNPHAGKTGYAPVQSGIVAALPFLDALVAGHSVAAFRELLKVVGDA